MRTSNERRGRGVAGLLMLFLLAAGCSNQTAENAATPAPVASAAGVTPASAGKAMTVAVIPKGLTHVFWQSVKAGAEKAGQENNDGR